LSAANVFSFKSLPSYQSPMALNIRWQINLQRMPWTVCNWHQQS